MTEQQGLILAGESEINEAAWQEWVEWRRVEKRKKVTPRAEKMQRKMLAQFGHEQQRQIIEHSMMNDYQGLFPEKVRWKVGPKLPTRATTLAEDLSDTSWAD